MGDEKVETACLDLLIQEFCCDRGQRGGGRGVWGVLNSHLGRSCEKNIATHTLHPTSLGLDSQTKRERKPPPATIGWAVPVSAGLPLLRTVRVAGP